MKDFLIKLFSSDNFMPHGMCYLWRPGVLWLHITSDALIALAYYSIPFTLLYFIRKRRDIPFNWMFLFFAIFIIACGTTHLMEIVVIWHPLYWLAGGIKAITAIVSVPTAILLVRLLPQALALPSPSSLATANARLEQEVTERKRAEDRACQLNQELERHVAEQTQELEKTNENLVVARGERKQADEKLNWLASFPEQSPNPIVELDLATGNILYENGFAARLFPDLQSQRLQHPYLFGLGDMADDLRSGKVEFLRRDVSVRGRHYAQAINYIPENHRLRVYGTDVTALKEAEEALRESRAQYHSLVEQMPAGVFRKDSEGRFVFVNSWFCDLSSTKPEQYLGKKATEVAHELAKPRSTTLEVKGAAELLARGDGHHTTIMQTGKRIEMEEKRVLADGRAQYFHVVKSPVFDTDGKITGSQGVLLDITERKEAEQKIHQLNIELEQRVIERTAELQAANKELEAFSYSVSHDLRAPLRAINGFADVVLQEFSSQLPEDGQRFLVRIREGGKQMGMLIDDLLAFSRLGRQPLNFQPVSTGELVKNVLEELKPLTADREVRFEIEGLPDGSGDPALLKQVWINLLSNAIKYSRNKKPAVIKISCTRNNNEDIFTVRDNGVGFEMQYAGKLFGVFQRLHRADEFEGTGVGLAIVQRVVQRHGGRIWAEGEVNRGASFYFTLKSQSKT